MSELEVLRQENAKLKQTVADLTRDRHLLREAVRRRN
jgi:cell division protein FtsB